MMLRLSLVGMTVASRQTVGMGLRGSAGNSVSCLSSLSRSNRSAPPSRLVGWGIPVDSNMRMTATARRGSLFFSSSSSAPSSSSSVVSSSDRVPSVLDGSDLADEEEGVEPEDADEGHPYKEVFQAVLDHVRAAMQSNEIERQRECFEKALALIRGDEHLSRRNVLKLVLAGYEEDAGQLERAKALLLEVVHSLDAPSWRPHYMLGRIYASENSMQAAHDSLSRAVELGSHSFPDGDLHWTQSLLLRAQLNLALGRPELAMSDTSVLLQEAPQHRSPHREGLMIRGELSLQTRASFDAIRDFGVILSDESTFVDAEVARSVAYIQLMRKEIARRDLVHAQSVDTVRTYAALLRYAPYIESPSPAFASFVERRAAVEIPPFEEDNAALNNHVAAHTQEFTDLFKQVLQELQ